MFTGIQNGVMFDRRSDDVIAGLNHAEDCQVVSFRPAAGKHDFCWLTSEKSGYRFASAFHRRACLLPVMMNGRSIPEALGKVRLHGLEHFGQHGGGCVVIEINSPHASIVRKDPSRQAGAWTDSRKRLSLHAYFLFPELVAEDVASSFTYAALSVPFCLAIPIRVG